MEYQEERLTYFLVEKEAEYVKKAKCIPHKYNRYGVFVYPEMGRIIDGSRRPDVLNQYAGLSDLELLCKLFDLDPRDRYVGICVDDAVARGKVPIAF